MAIEKCQGVMQKIQKNLMGNIACKLKGGYHELGL